MNLLLSYLRMNKSCGLPNGASHGTLVHCAGVGGEVISALNGVSIIVLHLVVDSCIISTLHCDLCVHINIGCVILYQYCVCVCCIHSVSVHVRDSLFVYAIIAQIAP